jgi:hypothetical protein
VVFALFLGSFVGQTVAGYHVFNDDREDHKKAQVTFSEYLTTGHFSEATFENWESEFLQMGMFVLLTAWLVQKGASESKKPDEGKEREKDSRAAREGDSPWPVHKGGLALKLYEHSLSSVLLILFVGSFLLHVVGGVHEHNREALEHGGQVMSFASYLGSSQLWFESFQNWQSEFFSLWALLLLSIVLREKGSPQSKPVTASAKDTGGD